VEKYPIWDGVANHPLPKFEIQVYRLWLVLLDGAQWIRPMDGVGNLRKLVGEERTRHISSDRVLIQNKVAKAMNPYPVTPESPLNPTNRNTAGRKRLSILIEAALGRPR
jgi:hypothetical protein